MLIRNTLLNLVGMGAPLVVALFAIPPLIAHLGADRFGLLTLIWAVVSYFSLFDLGLGRALTQQLSTVLAEKAYERVGPLVATAALLMAGLGVLATLAMAGLASWGVSMLHEVPDRKEALSAVYAMAVAMPAIVLTSGFRGVLEARHEFAVINMIRLPMGLFTFLGPLAVVVYGEPRLDWIAWVLAAGRFVAALAHCYFGLRGLSHEGSSLAPSRALVRPLVIAGGWLTVSNVISPFMGYVDRFVIGAVVSASAVAFYVTPQEIVTKLWIVPGALTMVLFPTFASQIAMRDDASRKLFGQSVYWLFLALLPVTAALAIFAPEILALWVGDEFAVQSAPLLRIFSVGIFVNCLAHVPFTLIQSAGAARATALIHAMELPFFLAALWLLATAHGILGAALAWLLRIMVDTALMFGAAVPILGLRCARLATVKTAVLAAVSAAAFAGSVLQPLGARLAWFAAISAVVAALLAALWRETRPSLAVGGKTLSER